MNRRGFLRGAATFLAAPAIVRVASLMPVVSYDPLDELVAESERLGLYDDFDPSLLRIKATERFAYGWIDQRSFSSPNVQRCLGTPPSD